MYNFNFTEETDNIKPRDIQTGNPLCNATKKIIIYSARSEILGCDQLNKSLLKVTPFFSFVYHLHNIAVKRLVEFKTSSRFTLGVTNEGF